MYLSLSSIFRTPANRLRWFEQIERRSLDYVIRTVDQMERSEIDRDRERSRKIIKEVIKKDLEFNNLDKIILMDRNIMTKFDLYSRPHLIQ